MLMLAGTFSGCIGDGRLRWRMRPTDSNHSRWVRARAVGI